MTQVREGRMTTGNADIYLPISSVFTLFGADREEPVSWYKEDGTHLVVGTFRYVLRLENGRVCWKVRIPSAVKQRWQVRTKVCPGPDDVIWAVQWTYSTDEQDEHEKPIVERRITFCAISRQDGAVLAKATFEVPEGIRPDLLAIMPWKQECLVLFGDSDNLRRTRVEKIVHYAYAGGRIAFKTDDPLGLVNCAYVDGRIDVSGCSTIVKTAASGGGTLVKVVRSGDFPARSIVVPGPPDDTMLCGALDIISDDVLLSTASAGKEHHAIAYDLRSGQVIWRHPMTPVRGCWGYATVGDSAAYVFTYEFEIGQENSALYMVDWRKARAEPLVSAHSDSVPGELPLGPLVAVLGDAIVFATDDVSHNDEQCTHQVYTIRLSDRSIRPFETVRFVAGKGEPPLSGPLRFVVSAAKGYWLGSSSAIAYREYESPQTPKTIQVEAEVKPVPGPAAAAQLHERVQALVRKLNAPDRKERLAAIEALSEMGAEAQEALSAIIPLLADKDAGVRHGAGYALLDICPSVEALRQVIPVMVQTLNDKTKDADTRALAAEEIGELPGLAAEAAEPLISATEDAEAVVRRAAVEALGNVKASPQRSIPALVSALGDKDDSVRADAAFALAQYGPAAKEASAALTRALEDSSEHVRSQAAYALREIGAAGGAPTPDVLRMLTDRSADVRREALVILWNTGSASEEEVQAVMKALSDGDELVRWVAAETLGRLGPSAQGAVPALMALLNSSDRTLRWGAVEALGRIGPAAQEAIPALLDGFMTDTAERGRVGRALGMMGPAAKSAVPALIQALNGKEIGLRSMAAAALGEIGQYATDAQPELIKALKDPEASVRWQAAQALGRLPPSEAAAAALGPMLSDKNRDVRLRAADAIAKMGPFAAKAHEDLLQALKGNDRYVRSSVAEALAKSGRADVGVPVLIEGLKDVQVGMWAAEALGEIGAPARQALPALLEAMKGDNDNLRRAAALAVVRLGETDNGLPILIKALKHEVPDTRAYTAEVLGQVGPPAKKAVGALREAMKDESPAVRKAAAEALRKIEHDGK
jgi:HEAT repeat protein